MGWQEDGLEVEQIGLELASICDTGITNDTLTHCHLMPNSGADLELWWSFLRTHGNHDYTILPNMYNIGYITQQELQMIWANENEGRIVEVWAPEPHLRDPGTPTTHKLI